MKEINIGDKYGRLTITRECPKDNNYRRVVECLCDCGKTKVIRFDMLFSGNTKSCGCLHIERNKSRSKTKEEKYVVSKVWRENNKDKVYSTRKRYIEKN